ncbi:MAG: hypothetical protein WDW38_005384 [Sanguina aurantia]
MPLAQGKGVQEAMGRRVAVIGREKLMKLAGVGELAVVEKAVAAAVAANVQVADLAVAVLALELLQDLKAATAGTDGRRLRRSIEAWEAFAAPLSTPLLDPEAAAAASAVRVPAAEADTAAAATAAAGATDAAWSRAEDEAAAAAWEERCSSSPNPTTPPPLPALAHPGCSVSGRHNAWGLLREGSEEGGKQGGGGTSAGRSRGGMKSDGVVCRRGAGAQGEQALRSYTKWVEEKRVLDATKKAELLAFQARLKEAGRLEKLARSQDSERIRYLEQGWPSRHTCPYKHGTFTDTSRLEYTRQAPPRPSSAPLSLSAFPFRNCGLDSITPSTGRPHTALPYRRDVTTPPVPSTQRIPPRHPAPAPQPCPPLGHTMGPPTKNRVRATTAPSMRTPLVTPTHPSRGTGGSPIPVTVPGTRNVPINDVIVGLPRIRPTHDVRRTPSQAGISCHPDSIQDPSQCSRIGGHRTAAGFAQQRQRQ